MKRYMCLQICAWFAVLCTAGVLAAPQRAEALILRGQFPIYNGMYWNFADNATGETLSWVMAGTFALPGIGSVRVLTKQGVGFVALKEKWDGLYLCGEYRLDGYTEPDKPMMFMPFEVDFDQPIISTARMRVYDAGEGPALTDEYDQTVTFSLKSVEDISFENREFRNCAVLTKTTEANGMKTVETFWLVPSIGPVKMRMDDGTKTRTYKLQSYRTYRGEPPQKFYMPGYFPLEPGIVYEYRDHTDIDMSITVGKKEKKLGWETISYAEPCGDIYFLTQDDRGFVFPVKFFSTMGFAFVSLPPDKPAMLFPEIAAMGRLNRSLTYQHPTGWPSLDPMLDFYPESEIISIVVDVEDVTVPAGTYKNCIKLYLNSVTRSFNMQREKVRSGFVWLAPYVGEVKREGVSFSNAYLDETPDHVFQTYRWELTGISRMALPEAVVPDVEAVLRPDIPPDIRVPPEDFVWQDNSRAMFDAAVDAAPFFVRRIVRNNLFEALSDRVDASGVVTEDAVMSAVDAATPERMRHPLVSDIEAMRTQK